MILKNEQPHCGKKALFPEEKKYEAYDVAIQALEQSTMKVLTAHNTMEILIKHLTENNLMMCSKEFVEEAEKALEKLSDIEDIINCPLPIQEDVIRYKAICKVVKK